MLRNAPDDLTALFDAVVAEPTAWEFFALVRAAEHARPGAPRTGTALDPADETLDLAHEPSASFPRTTVASFTPEGRRPQLRSSFLGLTGPMGPLPLHLTEIAITERGLKGGTPFGDFLDMISARMLQAFYRAWAESSPCAQADRPADDSFAARLGATSGAANLRFVSGATRAGIDEPGFGDWRRLAYGGHLAGLRSAAAVADLLSHVLERPVSVVEAVGRWRVTPPEARSRIGRNGAHNSLGIGATLGGRFYAVEWDVEFRVEARSMADLEDFLPGGSGYVLLAEAATAMLPAHIEWQARVEIDERAVTPARLGSARLGMTGWIAPRRREVMRADLRLAGKRHAPLAA